jgi:hypothetical protein
MVGKWLEESPLPPNPYPELGTAGRLRVRNKQVRICKAAVFGLFRFA